MSSRDVSAGPRRAAHAAEVHALGQYLSTIVGSSRLRRKLTPLPSMLFHLGLRSVDGRSVPWDLEGEDDVAGTERRAGTEWGQMRSTIGKGLVFVVADRHLHHFGPDKAWNADR